MDICPEFFSKYPGWTQPALAGTSGLSCASPPTHTNRGFWRETRQAEPSRKEAIDESFQKCASWLPAPVPPPLVLSVGSKVPRQAGALPGALVEPQASPRAGNDPSSKWALIDHLQLPYRSSTAFSILLMRTQRHREVKTLGQSYPASPHKGQI